MSADKFTNTLFTHFCERAESQRLERREANACVKFTRVKKGISKIVITSNGIIFLKFSAYSYFNCV